MTYIIRLISVTRGSLEQYINPQKKEKRNYVYNEWLESLRSLEELIKELDR